MATKQMRKENKRLTVIKGQEYLSPESKKALMDRLARIEGHVRSVRKMIEEHRCADEVLLQLGAIKAAVSQVAVHVADHEMKACVKSCMQGDANERLERTLKVISSLIRQ
ncbi:metal-sensitive transcriptional regulator [bacterium]|nr:metal-sensitive transcriptional regulator [bacterium]MCI0605858.1 metal-sensitive transcriptional regulator [bacterium]